MDRFPMMVYRDGSEIDVDGRGLDTLIVADDAALSDAVRDGWAAFDALGDAGNVVSDAPRPRGRPRKVVE